MVLGKLPVLGRPTIWITVWQGPTALAVGAGGGCLDIFTLVYLFSSFSLSLGDGPISGLGRKKREVIDERKNVQTTPTRTYLKRNRPLPYYYPNK